MKKIKNILSGILVLAISLSTFANSKNNTISEYAAYNGYGNSFIFVENGVEFSVFPDGQFDFNILRNTSSVNIAIGSPNINFSFNSGYNYNAFVQYDEFGAIVQIENIPIYYDYYGRIAQAGSININYNNYGYINRVGGLNVFYYNNRYSHCTGYINIYNRGYIYRPWHRYYSVPANDYCVVYNRPYRQYYRPVRYTYARPFYNNYRPRTSIANRRGNNIYRNKSYATVNRSRRNVTQINRNANNKRYYASNNLNPRGQGKSKSKRQINYAGSKRPKYNENNQRNLKGNKLVSNASRRETTYRPNTNDRKKVNSNHKRTDLRNTKTTQRSVVKNNSQRNATTLSNRKVNVVQKPKRANTRIYNKDNSRNSQVAQYSNSNRRNNTKKATQNRKNSNNTRSVNPRRS